MNRRQSFRRILALAVTWFAGQCQRIYGAVSRWSWPGYPSQTALRSHMANSSNHRWSDRDVAGKSFEELIRMHDRDHGIRRGDSPRWRTPRLVPGTSGGSNSGQSAQLKEPEAATALAEQLKESN